MGKAVWWCPEQLAGSLMVGGRKVQVEVSKSCALWAAESSASYVNLVWPRTSHEPHRPWALCHWRFARNKVANGSLDISYQAEPQGPLLSLCVKRTSQGYCVGWILYSGYTGSLWSLQKLVVPLALWPPSWFWMATPAWQDSPRALLVLILKSFHETSREAPPSLISCNHELGLSSRSVSSPPSHFLSSRSRFFTPCFAPS